MLGTLIYPWTRTTMATQKTTTTSSAPPLTEERRSVNTKSATVTNNVEMTDSTTIDVHVSYAGHWNDFEIVETAVTLPSSTSTP